MKLVGANGKAVASGLERQPGIVNYFIGNDPTKWRTRVPTYAKAKLAGVYPGIDVVYYGAEARGKGQEARGTAGRQGLSRLSPLASCLEYDFVVRPGADPSRIKLAFEGADRIRVADGDLILSTPAGDVRMKRPCAYQTIAGKRVQVACDYRISGQRATLRLARYDATKPLVVDPVIKWPTWFGTRHNKRCTDVATRSTDRPVSHRTWTRHNRHCTDVATHSDGSAILVGYTEYLPPPDEPAATRKGEHITP